MQGLVINDREDQQGKDSGRYQAADNYYCQWFLTFRSYPVAHGSGQKTDGGHHGGHHHRTRSNVNGIDDGLVQIGPSSWPVCETQRSG